MINQNNFDIADLSLSEKGRKKIEWASSQMPVLKLIQEGFSKNKPLKGLTIGACLHVTSETANLVLTLIAGGAKVGLCASNPLSTQDEVAASLVKDYDVPVFAVHGEDNDKYYSHIKSVLDMHPQITMDDGADLINTLHKKYLISQQSSFWGGAKRRLQNRIDDSGQDGYQLVTRQARMTSYVINTNWQFYGSSEETTTGVIRLKAMEKDKALKVPVIAVNDSDTKHLFDNRYGTGQSTVDGILRSTNILLAGKKAVVCGYGWCGRGIANRLRGMGAIVTIVEVDPVKALEAVMDGFIVNKIGNAIRYGELFVTATGDKNVINLEHLETIKDGAILANSGHFNVEIDYEGLVKVAKSRRILRNNLEEFVLPGGKKIFILAEGRLVNLVSADGHPAEVMDMSFADQALAAIYLFKNKGKLKPKVYTLPKSIDRKVATLKLRAMGVKFDRLTKEQRQYLGSWQEGT